jgi:hypothetical protein
MNLRASQNLRHNLAEISPGAWLQSRTQELSIWRVGYHLRSVEAFGRALAGTYAAWF